MQAALDTETIEQKALAAAVLVDAERFLGLGIFGADEADRVLLEDKEKGNSEFFGAGEKVGLHSYGLCV